MRHWKFMAIIVILFPLLAGCLDSNEPEQMVYIHGLGVDYKKGRYIIYLQMVNLGKLAKSEVGGGEKMQMEVGRASGKSMDEALFALYKSIQRKVFWGHLSFIVFTEEALKNKALNDTIDLFDRYRETRYRIWMFSTKGDVKQLLLSSPMLGISTALTRVAEPRGSYDQSSILKPMNMRELIMQLDEPGYNAVIPTVSIAKNTWQSNEKKRAAIQADGVAIITPRKLQGFISSNDVKGLRWMTEESKRNGLLLKKKGRRAAYVLLLSPSVTIQPEVKNQDVYFTIKIKVSGYVNEIDQKISEEFLCREAEKVIEKEVQQTYLKGLELDADVYRLSNTLYKKNVDAWKKVAKNGVIPLRKDSISVQAQVKIRHVGKQRLRPTIQ
ncbi:Ger(x)C family spore germination protein [Aneurinibacillus uraniidurans]|uniref:Ger(x)C family spore germination protein n=1 Tax=Aneurinibacillus uraniidurans TaxID=2966586 RepID=UPI00234BFCA0|nr:Ger(x)C family spore germination protein [Aneurinibacillus sp. B1]WCN37473.1 Ger(x)C family spore germination protein [Aneurinibacillus sp. B1]